MPVCVFLLFFFNFYFKLQNLNREVFVKSCNFSFPNCEVGLFQGF